MEYIRYAQRNHEQVGKCRCKPHASRSPSPVVAITVVFIRSVGSVASVRECKLLPNNSLRRHSMNEKVLSSSLSSLVSGSTTRSADLRVRSATSRLSSAASRLERYSPAKRTTSALQQYAWRGRPNASSASVPIVLMG